MDDRYLEQREYWLGVCGETVYNAAFGLLPAWLPRYARVALARRVAVLLFYRPAARDVGPTRLSRVLSACVQWLDAQDDAVAQHVIAPNDDEGERDAMKRIAYTEIHLTKAIRAWRSGEEAPDAR